MKFLTLLTLAAAVSAQARSATDYLWPLPQNVVDKKQTVAIGGFSVTSNLGARSIATAVASLNTAFAAKGGKTGTKFPVVANVDPNNGWSVSGPADLVGASEAYTLDITEKGATITAPNQIGIKYALQTLSQLITNDGKLVLATVKDSPAFPYRGLMLDTARNFFPVEDIKRIIDGLAASKLNVFHWHIYDSQSFPIEWLSYPQVHQKAAYKNADGSLKIYTKKDVQDIVKYAFDRNIRVIPEFETPGHNAVLGHIDPDLISSWNHSPWDGNSFATNAMCSNQTVPVDKVTNDCVGGVVWWGRQFCNQPPCGQLDVRKEKALQILDQLINEVGSWFSDPVLHVGHDEVNTRAYGLVPDNWDSVPADALHPLMRNFDSRLLGMLGGKTLAAWDEIVTDFGVADIIPKQSLITLWNAPNGVPAAIENVAEKGFKNIAVAPSAYWYLDCSPSARWCSSDFERTVPDASLNIPGFKTFPGQWHNWTLIYDYEPLDSLSANAKSSVKGGFGALWSETVKRHNLDRYVFPRVAAIAERLWSNVKRDDKTATRLDRFRASLVNEKAIASATLEYLGNQEEFVFRPEYCDGLGLTAPGQKTAECCSLVSHSLLLTVLA
ncbi:glycoside hydrolase [Rhizoclosmatium globosum]|uniref:beta-N-acetylhexosaminidase n=1 Tax=Rhizoclosmatium globosum TaxID=329046 RepID=A0A1Y2C2W0_9FUNG|nr:glycoside hydrolase [Rhizoclosmatium globosum]|eukprot:ORY41383.1 glycoside hydrolase [Rhizoclosmatium globosum]